MAFPNMHRALIGLVCLNAWVMLELKESSRRPLVDSWNTPLSGLCLHVSDRLVKPLSVSR